MNIATTKRDDRALQALRLIMEACAAKQLVVPFEVIITDSRGTRIAAQIDHDGARPLAGDLGSLGLISPPLSVSVTDARAENALFAVELFDGQDGRPLPPIIGYPAAWTK